jgi:hypothetical protein
LVLIFWKTLNTYILPPPASPKYKKFGGGEERPLTFLPIINNFGEGKSTPPASPNYKKILRRGRAPPHASPNNK